MLDNFLKIISQVKRTLLACTYVLFIGVLRTRGLRSHFALHVLFIGNVDRILNEEYNMDTEEKLSFFTTFL